MCIHNMLCLSRFCGRQWCWILSWSLWINTGLYLPLQHTTTSFYKRLKYTVKKCHYGLEMNDLFHAVKHTGMPRACLWSVCWYSGPQTPWASCGPGTAFTSFPFLKAGEMHTKCPVYPLPFFSLKSPFRSWEQKSRSKQDWQPGSWESQAMWHCHRPAGFLV